MADGYRTPAPIGAAEAKTRVGVAAIVGLALPLTGGCSAQKPDWVHPEGWLAAQCYAAAEVLVERGHVGMTEEVDTWRGLTYAFVGTTDQGMELRDRAQASINPGSVAQFFTHNCGSDAVANVERVL